MLELKRGLQILSLASLLTLNACGLPGLVGVFIYDKAVKKEGTPGFSTRIGKEGYLTAYDIDKNGTIDEALYQTDRDTCEHLVAPEVEENKQQWLTTQITREMTPDERKYFTDIYQGKTGYKIKMEN